MNSDLHLCLTHAVSQDPKILTPKDQVEKSLGEDPRYLESLGLEKHHLIRLERMGLAIKARYQTENKRRRAVTGPHRVRWIILEGALS